jgi:hypothetical protein
MIPCGAPVQVSAESNRQAATFQDKSLRTSKNPWISRRAAIGSAQRGRTFKSSRPDHLCSSIWGVGSSATDRPGLGQGRRSATRERLGHAAPRRKSDRLARSSEPRTEPSCARRQPALRTSAKQGSKRRSPTVPPTPTAGVHARVSTRRSTFLRFRGRRYRNRAGIDAMSFHLRCYD